MKRNEPSSEPLFGRLRKYHSDFYYVDVVTEAGQGELYECKLRGLLKKEGVEVLVGDQVTLDSLDRAAKTARITGVLPRTSEIHRPKIANVDQVLIVYSLREPAFEPHQLDRYLTHVTLAGLTPLILVSKSDLAEEEAELAKIRALYQDSLGYSLIFTSVHRPDSIEPVLKWTKDRISVLAGPSGSGKSSLLNAMNPEFQLKIGEVSEKIARGQHTTRHVELLRLDGDTYVADTPGFSNLKFNYVLPGAIEAIYPDFAPYREHCEFSDCLHLDEAGCAVLENIEKLSESRYGSYRDILKESELYKQQVQNSSTKEEYGYKTLDRKGKEERRILRLKGRDRDASRRTERQKVEQMLEDEEIDDLDAFSD